MTTPRKNGSSTCRMLTRATQPLLHLSKPCGSAFLDSILLHKKDWATVNPHRIAYLDAVIFQFFSDWLDHTSDEKNWHPSTYALLRTALYLAFDCYAGIAYGTYAKMLTILAATSVGCSEEKAKLLGNTVHYALSLYKDTTPVGMLHTTLIRFTTNSGYETGSWLEKTTSQKTPDEKQKQPQKRISRCASFCSIM